MPGCAAVIRRGPREGEVCGLYCNGLWCTRHAAHAADSPAAGVWRDPTAVVRISCVAGLGVGTCPVTAWGRVGEDVGETMVRAFGVGWGRQPGPLAEEMRWRCPWHASGRFGGSGPL